MGDCEEPNRKRAYSRREPEPLTSLPADVWFVEHVGRALGVSESWVYKRVAAEEIPFTKRAGVLRFDPTKVMAWARGESAASPSTVVPIHGKGR